MEMECLHPLYMWGVPHVMLFLAARLMLPTTLWAASEISSSITSELLIWIPFSDCSRHLILTFRVIPFESHRLVNLANASSSGDVKLGHCEHESFTDIPWIALGDSYVSQPEALQACAPSLRYTVDEKAVSIGDMPDSQIKLSLHKKDLRNDFTISISFRTYQPDGMILFAHVSLADNSFLNIICSSHI